MWMVLKDPYYEEYFTAGEKERLKNGERFNLILLEELKWYGLVIIMLLYCLMQNSLHFFLNKNLVRGYPVMVLL